jgi:outer membrane autotransporter protein
MSFFPLNFPNKAIVTKRQLLASAAPLVLALSVSAAPHAAAQTVTLSGDTDPATVAEILPGNNLTIGVSAAGSMTITGGGQISNADGMLGAEGQGEALVSGAGSSWKNSGRLTVGAYGAGSLRIEDGARVENGLGIVGTGARGDIVVTGADTTWVNGGSLAVGNHNVGMLLVEDGATVTSSQGFVGGGGPTTASGTIGSVTVTGAGSSWSTVLNISIGNYGTGTLIVEDGALVRAGGGIRLASSAAGDSGTLVVQGTDTARTVLETSQISRGNGTASVTIDGGIVRATQNNAYFIDNFSSDEFVIGSGGSIFDSNGFEIGIGAGMGGAGTLIKTGLGVLTLSGNNAYTGGTAIEGGTVRISSDANLGSAAGRLSFDGGTLNTTADIITGRSVDLIGAGTFLTDAGTAATLTGAVSGAGSLAKDGGGTLVIAGTATHSGGTTIAAGTLAAGATNTFSAASANTILGGGTLALNGFNQTIAALDNAGLVSFGGAPGTMLTVSGNYVGNGGTLVLNTTLGGDASPTDRLVVNGDTSGTSKVRITNIDGGGAPTVDGIKVIEIGGLSNGIFNLLGDYMLNGEQVVVAGAYGYALRKNGVSTPTDGDWYLRSMGLAPTLPVYENYPQVLLGMVDLPTLQQRVGTRYWTALDGAAPTGAATPSAIWARIEGAHGRVKSAGSHSGDARFDNDSSLMQIGLDGQLAANHSGMLVSGLTAQYGRASADIYSGLGDGSNATTSYGVGATLTWYGENGFYVDGQAQLATLRSNLSAADIGSIGDGIHGSGYALSLEAGRKTALGGGWSLTPQAQLAYATVDFDRFTDRFGAEVALRKGDSLKGRLGVAADYEPGAGTHVYGIGNLTYEFLDGTAVAVSGVDLAIKPQRFGAELGLGGTYGWEGGKYALHGEALAATSFQGSRSLKGTAGFTMGF